MKREFASNLARHALLHSGKPVLVVNSEVTREQVEAAVTHIGARP